MIATVFGFTLILVMLWECFESLVLPRRVTRRWRFARQYYRVGWLCWRQVSRMIPVGRYRANMLSIFGPLSLLGLFVCWGTMIIVGFAHVQWEQETLPDEQGNEFRQCLYQSGETFFTLGYGDVTPTTYFGKFVAVGEAGAGFGFMAVVIGYLPVLYQTFSRREQNIALLDARAGSPPTAAELFRRVGSRRDHTELERYLGEWEVWAADLLESHLSYPVLSYYRSQHDNQNWLSAMAVLLDASAVLLVVGNETEQRRAQLTFAMARHTCVDLCLVYWLPPMVPEPERLTRTEAEGLLSLTSDGEVAAGQVERLDELRELYEPFIEALSKYFYFDVPRFVPSRHVTDNWQTTAWTKRAPGITELPAPVMRADEHFG